MMETWHPLGVCGVISAFNFPVAVWAWNAALALVCGDPVVWKPSDRTPLTAIATQAIVARAMRRFGDAPAGLSEVLIGGRDVGEMLVDDSRVAIVSATGSTAMGRAVGPRLAARFARAILELGGNNAAIVAPSADLDLALRAIAFAAMGTAGQRCTTLRRLFVADAIYQPFLARLSQVYASVKVGDPRDPDTLVGPLIDGAAFENMQRALSEARSAGGKIKGGERAEESDDAYYVRPALCEMPEQSGPVLRETFAPILYVHAVFRARRGDPVAQCGRSRAFLVRLHARPARGRALPVSDGIGLRHRQCQHRTLRRRDRRCIRRRKRDRRRARGRLRQLEGLHAPGHQHDKLWNRAAACAGREIRYLAELPPQQGPDVRQSVGFTAGIALIIFASQIKELFGLTLGGAEPELFFEKLSVLWRHAPSFEPAAVAISTASVAVIVGLKKARPHWPGMLIAVAGAAAATAMFDLPVATIGSKFGGIPSSLPVPSLPEVSLAKLQAVFPSAAAFALLGSIESLLSAVVADGMTGRRHRSNCELVGQGVANVASGLFGGICVTGTVARTATNVRAGAHGPIAGMLHAIFLLIFVLTAAPARELLFRSHALPESSRSLPGTWSKSRRLRR